MYGMNESEWQAAERREPDKTYIQPDFMASERLERAAWACFAAMAIVGLAAAWQVTRLWPQYLNLIAASI